MAEKRGGDKSQGGASAKAEKNKGSKIETGDLLKKMTPVTILGEKIAKLAPKNQEDEPVHLYTVFGIANGTKTGHTQFGDWTALTGMFEAFRVSDRRRFQSAVCFVPGAAGDIIIGGLRANREKNPEASIHFAIEVHVKAMERRDGTMGYEYVTKERVKVEQADVLFELRAAALGYDG